MFNLRKIDNLIKRQKGLSNSKITGANNTRVSGQNISETLLNSLNNLNEQIQAGQEVSVEELKSTTIWVLGTAGLLFAIVCSVVAAILSKFIIYPINKLIKSAEKIAEDDKNAKKLFNSKKGNEAKDLDNVLGVMTTELKEKLSEVSTQKKKVTRTKMGVQQGCRMQFPTINFYILAIIWKLY